MPHQRDPCGRKTCRPVITVIRVGSCVCAVAAAVHPCHLSDGTGQEFDTNFTRPKLAQITLV